MKYATLTFLLFMAFIGAAFAQNPNTPLYNGYFFVGPGAATGDCCCSSATTMHIGGGVEGTLYKGLGAGIELGYLGPMEAMQDGIGMLSVDGAYYFRTKTSTKVVPFVNAGYTLAFREGVLNAINFGGGIQYWFHKRIGLRLEFRDHIAPMEPDTHLWNFRIGMALR